jgi:DNA-binding NarL/FixJ family response regulator
MAATAWQRPTRRQLEVLRAYIAAGSITAAAHELDIAESTTRQHLSGLYRRTGCLSVAQAAYRLGTGELGRSLPRSRSSDGHRSGSRR